MKHSESGHPGLPVQRWQQAGFALYVHWPFCQAKCPYCDFNSHVAAVIDQESWVDAYVSEIKRFEHETPGRVLRSIFFGGGTPSLMAPATVGRIIEAAAAAWAFSNDIEITLEANPTSVEAGKFRAFRSAGINRVSIGVQALNDADLRKLGRVHSANEAIEAIKIAQRTFDRSSFDLIYARQGQSLDDWRKELARGLDMAGEHLSLYQLTIEPGTVFAARHDIGQLRGLPGEDLSADMFLLTQEICADAGMPAYEVSNHAIPGAESRHNVIYWDCGDYVGIGPGAHGRLSSPEGRRFATVCPKSPGEWLAKVRSGDGGEVPREQLSNDDQASEFLMMGLRLTRGIDLGDLYRTTGRRLDPVVLLDLENEGHITVTGSSLKTTSSGRLLLNSVTRALLQPYSGN